MPAFSLESPLERPRLALANLLYGPERGEGTVRSIFAPNTLSPIEAQDLLDRLGVSSENTVFDTALRTLTNPLVIIGAVMGLRYPVPLLKNLRNYSEQVRKGAERHMVLGNLKGPMAIFGKDRPELYESLVDTMRSSHRFKGEFLPKMAQLVHDFEKDAGRVFNAKDDFVLGVLLNKNMHYGIPGFKKTVNPFNAGAIDRYADGPLRRLADRTRELNKEVWAATMGSPEWQAVLSEELPKSKIARRKLRRAGLTAKTATPEDLIKLGIYPGGPQAEYFPWTLSKEGVLKNDWIEAQLQAIGASEKTFGTLQAKSIQGVMSGHEFGKKFNMAADPLEMEKYVGAGFVDEKRLQQYASHVNNMKMISIGEKGLLPHYRIGYTSAFATYVNGLAGTLGWTIRGNGDKINRHLQEMLHRHPHSDPRAKLLANTYIPIVKGRLAFNQIIASQQWANSLDWVNEQLGGKMGKWLDKAPGGRGVKEWLERSIAMDRGPLSMVNFSSGAAGYLYLSTLGLNAGSAALNLMQTALTTIPTIGLKATGAGIGRVFEGSKKYFSRRAKGDIHEVALAKAFPDFAEAGLVDNPITDEAVKSAFSYAWDEGALKLPGRYAKGVDRVKRSMMALFTATESFNRLVAFEGAMWKGAQEGLELGTRRKLAQEVTAMTQFLSGPETTPAFLATKNPLLRQYLMFPSKALEFVTDTATTVGSGEKSGLFGRNWGTLGRALMASGIAYEGGKGLLGADFSGGLITGTLPVPQEGNPFFPFPFVPPAVALAGAAASSALTGDPTAIQKSLPTLVPGGVALSRGVGFIPGLADPKVGRWMGRYYADYNNPDPAGGYPVYSQSGNLVGYESGMQIALKGLGIPGAGGDVRNEAQAVTYLLKNRDRIREYRRRYLEHAILRRDYMGAERIKDEFQRVYGIPLMIKETDIKAFQLRRDVPRLEKVLETMPAEMRPQFAHMIQTAVFAQGSNFMGVDPMLLSQGTVQTRMPHRRAFPSGMQGGYQRRGTYQQDMSATRNMNYEGIGRNELPGVQSTRGLTFGAFS